MKNGIKLPNIWGQGQLFCYSGLEGECDYNKNLVATTLGDRLGFQFRNLSSPTDRAYFVIRPEDLFNIYYKCITSDMICADIEERSRVIHSLDIVFVNHNTFVLRGTNISARLLFEYDTAVTEENGASLYVGNGNTFAMASKRDGDKIIYAVSYHDGAAKRAICALEHDIDATVKARYDFYKSLPRPAYFTDEAEERLYYKCYSILRSTVYTPIGKMSYCSLTPDRFPHRAVWLWDTAYIVPAMKHISYDVAKQAVLAILQCSHGDGFLPHMTTPDWQSEITQPPVLSWAALQLYRFGGDKDFLSECYDRLCAYVNWDREHRDVNGNGLPEWVVGDDPLCRCDESGLDNTPRFDEAEMMDCIDFAAFLANDMRCLSEIAGILGKESDSVLWMKRYNDMKDKTNELLWDEEDGFYYDRRLCDGKFHKVKASSSFITLFAGICDKDKAKKMVEHLLDPKEFATAFPIPTVSADYKTYHTKDMFNGTVWLNFNYLVSIGLEEYGFTKEAYELRKKTVDVIKQWYLNDGTVYEFYDSTNEVSPSRLSRKGTPLQPYMPEIRYQSVRDFTWGSMAVIEFLLKDRK